MKDRSHIIWPGVIILLLVGSIALMLGVFVAARSDGGAQVVDDYYAKASQWDSIATIQRSSNALTWRIEIRVETAAAGRTAVLSVVDADGTYVSGIQGRVSISRPQREAIVGEHRLVESQADPGRYSFEFPYVAPGLWDVTVDAELAGMLLNHRIRLEL